MLSPPPVKSNISEGKGSLVAAWLQWFNALYASIVGTKVFAITDVSGAGLAFTLNYPSYVVTAFGVTTISADITYPVTASGLAAALPLPVPSALASRVNVAVGYNSLGVPLVLSGGGSVVNIYNASTGAALTNANMSGKRIAFTFSYITG